MAFDYEMHSSLDVPVSQALEEVKTSILSDVAQRLGCTESIGRLLQDSSGNIIGFMSSRSDMPDPAAGKCYSCFIFCMVEATVFWTSRIHTSFFDFHQRVAL